MLEHVNKELFPIKAHYFLYNAATAPIVPFLPTIAKQLGFSSSVVGMVYWILPIFGLIVKPLFCGLADRFKLHKVLFILFQVVLTLGFLIIHFIPKVEPSTKVKFLCYNRAAFAQILLVDNSSLYDITKHEYSINTFTDCQMSCKASKIAYEEVCSTWEVPKYCNYVNKEVEKDATIDFIAKFNMNKELTMQSQKIYTELDFPVENVTFSDGITRKIACHKQPFTTCIMKCKNDEYLRKLLFINREKQSISETTSLYQFHLFLFAAIVSWVGMAVVVNIADTICFSLLGENKNDYGKQRMWGCIGFGIFAISAGYLVDIFSTDEFEKEYTCIFYILTIAMICNVIVTCTIKMKNTSHSGIDPSILKELYSIIKEPGVLVFAFWCIGAGMCTGVIWNFLFWYTEDIVVSSQRSWIKTVQGLLTGVQSFLGELPFNFASGMILKKLGHVNVMSLVLLAYAVRFMAYSIVSNVWIFLIFEILHGPSFGLCWPAMVSYGEKVAPPGTKATIQGLIGAIFEGIGVSFGSLIFGWIYDDKGVITFRIFSGGALTWLAIFWILQIILRKTKSHPLSQGHSHLHASYMPPDDALLMTMSQEMTTY